MIKGKAKLEFGAGDIRMDIRYSSQTGALCLRTSNPQEIGSLAPYDSSLNEKNAEVIMTFSKTESIDVLIEELLNVKKLMNNEIPVDKLMVIDEKLDFDIFLQNNDNEIVK